MKGAWRKLGQLYVPDSVGRHAKLTSHAANPLPVRIGADIYRVFYSGRDAHNRSSVGAVDIDIVSRRVVKDHFNPFFEHGCEGSFFADGVSIGNIYNVNGINYMLFMGWQAPSDSHWRGDIGRLILTPEFTLKIDSFKPLMSSNSADPISLSYPWVLPMKGGRFRMWYGSTSTWDAGNGEMLHILKNASSVDGHNWTRGGLAVPFVLGRAQAFSRPTVALKSGGGYEMWFSYRGCSDKYRIGYATSDNGLDWILDLDGAGITTSEIGWDSEMIEYPFVLDHDGQRFMFYNGNGYGRTGFGLAVWDAA